VTGQRGTVTPGSGSARMADLRAAAAGEPASYLGLLEKLMAAVRPEFRVDVYVPDPDDPVLGAGTCAARGCRASARTRHLCTGHYSRWLTAGSPDMAGFTASPGPGLAGHCEPACCMIEGCRYGTHHRGLCGRHSWKWRQSGCPDPAAWAAAVPAVSGHGQRECGLSFCGLWAEPAASPFCHAHTARWRGHGRPDPVEFTTSCELLGKPHIDYRGLAPRLRLELQYALQCRRDDKTVKTLPHDVMTAIRRLAGAGISSLLDWDIPEARKRQAGYGGDTPRALLGYAKDAVESLLHGSGWDTEYPRDVWRLDKLRGVPAGPGTRHRRQMRFDRICQPWLREIAKRWCRLRLSTGLSADTVLVGVRAVTLFSQFLLTAPQARSLAAVDRPLLERYIAWLAPRPGRVPGNAIGALNTLFTAIRQHGWDSSLPATAMFFPSDIPPRQSQADRHLAEHIMIQVEQPANLDRWPCPEGRLITLILMRGGLRASDACALAFDPLLHDGQGAPYLKYYNHKMRREAAIPIDEELEAEIRSQQRRVTERWPAAIPYLFPRLTGNAGGQRCFTYGAYWAMLKRWLITCDIRDEHGQPVSLTPHQWRHTFVICTAFTP
jgi:integrase